MLLAFRVLDGGTHMTSMHWLIALTSDDLSQKFKNNAPYAPEELLRA